MRDSHGFRHSLIDLKCEPAPRISETLEGGGGGGGGEEGGKIS